LSVIRKATELRIPILIDTWIKEDAEHQSLINCVAQIATKMSSATIILAHLGGPNFNNVLQVVRKTNVYFDLSFILTRLDHKMAHKRLVYLMKHVGPHRLIYGSDFPEINLKTYFENTRELLKCANITPKEKELIFCENICALCA
jgi:predicted TIM-barrel fold metal-dependent hydrolase